MGILLKININFYCDLLRIGQMEKEPTKTNDDVQEVVEV